VGCPFLPQVISYTDALWVGLVFFLFGIVGRQVSVIGLLERFTLGETGSGVPPTVYEMANCLVESVENSIMLGTKPQDVRDHSLSEGCTNLGERQ
jgi:hypothetical protein